MERRNESRYDTAFTQSIEAKHGVTTGISASDRSITIKTAINEQNDESHITTPGHVFPIIARGGGTLIRAGHTEAIVDIAKICGLNPSGVICEIMKDNGEMARLPDLKKFAKKHDLKIGTIADLISYRRKNENLLVRIKLKLKKDGTIMKSEILDHQRMNKPGQKFYKVLAESALRAVRLCQPLKVPPTGYDKWKELQLNFNPAEMLKG